MAIIYDFFPLDGTQGAIVTVVSFYLLGSISLWIVLMWVSVYKLKPYRAKDVRAAFLKTAMLATTTTTGFLFVISAIYLIIDFTFFQVGQVPETLLAVAFFGTGILFIWTFGNFWAEVIGRSRSTDEISETSEKLSKPQGEAYSCSNCGTPFNATKYDDTHPIASRTKGEYPDQMPIPYTCQKCKTQNIIYWSAQHFTVIGATRHT
jgi:rubredoxin